MSDVDLGLMEKIKSKYWRMNNLYYIQDKQRKNIKFKFNSIQEDVFRNRTGRDVYLKARQQTMSTFWILYFLDECLFNDNIEARTIADNEENIQKLFYKAKYAYDRMPSVIRNLYPLSVSTKYEMYIPRRCSRYKVCLETHSETVSMLHFSEVAFMHGDVWRKIDESTEAVPMGKGNTQIVFESIANGSGNEFHVLYITAKNGESIYKSHFYPWWLTDDYVIDDVLVCDYVKSTLTDIERKLMSGFGLSYGQIAWRRDKIRGFRGDIEKFKVKYPENDIECFLTSGSHLFNQHLVNTMLVDGKHPAHTAYVFEKNRLRKKIGGYCEIIEVPMPDEEYVLSCDVADGNKDSDYSVIYIFKKRGMFPVCRLKGKVDPEVMGEYAYMLGNFYNFALIGIELNNRGYTTVKCLVRKQYRNLYYDRMEIGGHFKEFGFTTTTRTRPLILDQLAHDFNDEYFECLPEGLLNEMTTFVNKDGRFEASNGSHDDEIMAFAIGLMLCYWFPFRNRVKVEQIKKMDYIGSMDSGVTRKEKVNAKVDYNDFCV